MVSIKVGRQEAAGNKNLVTCKYTVECSSWVVSIDLRAGLPFWILIHKHLDSVPGYSYGREPHGNYPFRSGQIKRW